MNIYVTNISLNLLDSDLRMLFSFYGEVASANIVRDKLNNRSRGYGYVNMPIEKEAQIAVLNLNDKSINGKKLTVKEIKYHPEVKGFD